MKNNPLKKTFLLCFLFIASGVAYADKKTDIIPTEEVIEIPGWLEFIDTLKYLPNEVLQQLPPDRRQDPQLKQEVARLILSAIASSSIASVGGDTNQPEFLPAIGHVLNIGQPNADTIYRSAEIDAKGIYKISGSQGSYRLVTISQSVKRKNDSAVPRVIDHNVNALTKDDDGNVEVILSTKRPRNYQGDWWPLDPKTSSLMMRMVSADWKNEVEPKLAIERLDHHESSPRHSAKYLEQRLRQLPHAIRFISNLFAGHVHKARSKGLINTLKMVDLSQMGGLDGQYYYEGVYDLKDDEALFIETTVPKQCLYSSLILTNELYETTDWYNHHSSLNDSQSKLDTDGLLRVVVSKQDPLISNWLDTAGHPIGMVQGRWTGCSEQPVPNVNVVKFSELQSLLPVSTPRLTVEQRKAIITERRQLLQRKSKW